jgi:hypothetical protein
MRRSLILLLAGCSGGGAFSSAPPDPGPELATIVPEAGTDLASSEASGEIPPESGQGPAESGQSPPDGPRSVCLADSDCAEPCPAPSMSPVCVIHPKGNWCSCTCDPAVKVETAACAMMCAPAAWSDCSTCSGQVLGRAGTCACGKLAPAGCQASTCTENAGCTSGHCAEGWCQP